MPTKLKVLTKHLQADCPKNSDNTLSNTPRAKYKSFGDQRKVFDKAATKTWNTWANNGNPTSSSGKRKRNKNVRN